MIEWVLIVTMHLISEPKSFRDVQVETISGFSTKSRCENSAKDIAMAILKQTGKHREFQEIRPNGSSVNFPMVNTECIKIEK